MAGNRAVRSSEGSLSMPDGSAIPRRPQPSFAPATQRSDVPAQRDTEVVETLVETKPVEQVHPDTPRREPERPQRPVSPVPERPVSQKTETVPVSARQSSIVNAAEAVSEAEEAFASEDTANVSKVVKRRGRPAKRGSETVQVKIPRNLFEQVKELYPNLTNVDAISAFIAMYTDSVDLLDDPKVAAAVNEVQQGRRDDASVKERLDKIVRMLTTMRREVAVASIASVAVVSDWYRRLDTGIDLERYLGLNDTIFETMEHLNSLSSEYEKQVSEANGRRVRGFGR